MHRHPESNPARQALFGLGCFLLIFAHFLFHLSIYYGMDYLGLPRHTPVDADSLRDDSRDQPVGPHTFSFASRSTFPNPFPTPSPSPSPQSFVLRNEDPLLFFFWFLERECALLSVCVSGREGSATASDRSTYTTTIRGEPCRNEPNYYLFFSPPGQLGPVCRFLCAQGVVCVCVCVVVLVFYHFACQERERTEVCAHHLPR